MQLLRGRVQGPLLEKPVYHPPWKGGAEYRGHGRKEEPCAQLNPTLLSTRPLSGFTVTGCAGDTE